MNPVAARLGGLRRFAVGISLLNLFGYLYLGFEQPWLQPLVALAVAYPLDLGLEKLDARLTGRAPRYAGGARALVDFLLPAHITALAVSMLLFANDRMAPIVFGVAVAIGSKWLLRVPVRGMLKHVMNPSNFGIAVVLLLFPSVGIAPPYQFTENFTGGWHWLVPAIIVVTGSFINARFSGRVPLIAAWLAGFAGQGVVRVAFFGAAPVAPLVPMTGAAFVLFTMYMITDPSTTPFGRREQVAFGLATAAAYGALLTLHVAFGLFFALTLVCAFRGALLALGARRHATERVAVPVAARAPREAAASVP
jgi:enediyne biosynthesis protein E5